MPSSPPNSLQREPLRARPSLELHPASNEDRNVRALHSMYNYIDPVNVYLIGSVG